MPRDRARDDLAHLGELEVRFVHPYQATKRYVCPDCGRDIAPGTGHYVVVPTAATDLRRHWHRGCWERRATPPATPTKAANKAVNKAVSKAASKADSTDRIRRDG